MEYRRVGGSDLQLPVVTFGAWAIGGWMWGGADDGDAIRGIHRAIDEGITCIDTAPTYGMGHSETLVGKAIADRRGEVLIATKCGVRWDSEEGQFSLETRMNDGTPCKLYRNLRPHSVIHECEESLKRLGVDVIDLYQCHWPDPTTPIADTMGAMKQLQDEGKIRFIGVSNFSPEQMAECLDVVNLVSNQPKYSLLDRQIEDDVLPFCRSHDIGILAYGPMHQGLLSGKVTADRAFPDTDIRSGMPWYQAGNRERVLGMLERIKPIADGHNATLAQVAINWVLQQPGVTTALVGARREDQAAENAGAASFKLSAGELQTLRKLAGELGEPQ